MDPRYELLASAHEADVLREARERRLASIQTGCRRSLLGLMFGRSCQPAPTS